MLVPLEMRRKVSPTWQTSSRCCSVEEIHFEIPDDGHFAESEKESGAVVAKEEVKVL